MPSFSEILTHINGCHVCTNNPIISTGLDIMEDAFTSASDYYSNQRFISQQVSENHSE